MDTADSKPWVLITRKELFSTHVSKPYEMTTCDNYFMMYVSQTMLYTLNL